MIGMLPEVLLDLDPLRVLSLREQMKFWRGRVAVASNEFNARWFARACASIGRELLETGRRYPMKQERAKELLEKLAEFEGMDPYDLVEANIIDSIVPCICSNGDCGHTTELEPDSREGYCEECESHSMISAVELMVEGALD
jgi:hypothetical protein